MYTLGEDYGASASGSAVADIQSLQRRLDELLVRQAREEQLRKWSLIIGAAAALFAAGRLGIAAIPFVRRKRGS